MPAVLLLLPALALMKSPSPYFCRLLAAGADPEQTRRPGELESEPLVARNGVRSGGGGAAAAALPSRDRAISACAPEFESTPLMLALDHGHMGVVHELLAGGAKAVALLCIW